MAWITRACIFACAALFVTSSAIAAPEGWLEDFARAVAQAKAEKKLLLIEFTGSDWNATCQKQEKEVFLTKEFQEYAAQNLVLLQVDFPKTREISNALRDQNNDLSARFGIRSYPTIVLANGDGVEEGRLVGYGGGGAKLVVAKIDAYRK